MLIALATVLVGLLFGVCLGSFVTMLSYRLPRGEDFIRLPSHCASCDARLTPMDLIPVFSWFRSQGICRHCGTKISMRYPLIELVMGAFGLGIVMLHGFSIASVFLAAVVTIAMTVGVMLYEKNKIPLRLWVALGVATLLYLAAVPKALWILVLLGGGLYFILFMSEYFADLLMVGIFAAVVLAIFLFFFL